MAKMRVKDLYDRIGEIAGKAAQERAEESRERAVRDANAPDQKSMRRKHIESIYGLDPNGVAKGVRRDHLGTKAVEDMSVKERALLAGRCIRYLHVHNYNVERAIEFAEARGESTVVSEWDATLTEKAMGVSTLAGGGAIVPEAFSSALIEELGAKSTVESAGIPRLNMPGGNLTLPYIDDSATASWTTEGSNTTKSEATTGQLQLFEKVLAGLVPVSNKLLRADAGPSADQFIVNHLIRVMRRKMDITLIRSLGASGEPRGMRGWAIAGNTFNANASVSVANVTTDCGKMKRLLLDLDVDLDAGAAWWMAPRSVQYLETARDGNDNLVWAAEIAQGRFMGYPLKMTSQIPITLGGGSDASEVYFAGVSTLVIGDSGGMQVDTFDGGAYYDGSTVQSGISRNETAIRTLMGMDFGAQHRGKEIALLEAVKWAA